MSDEALRKFYSQLYLKVQEKIFRTGEEREIAERIVMEERSRGKQVKGTKYLKIRVP